FVTLGRRPVFSATLFARWRQRCSTSSLGGFADERFFSPVPLFPCSPVPASRLSRDSREPSSRLLFSATFSLVDGFQSSGGRGNRAFDGRSMRWCRSQLLMNR